MAGWTGSSSPSRARAATGPPPILRGPGDHDIHGGSGAPDHPQPGAFAPRPAVLTIGRIEGGRAFNIIAESCTIEGTVRTQPPTRPSWRSGSAPSRPGSRGNAGRRLK